LTERFFLHLSNSLSNHAQVSETTILFLPIAAVEMRLVREANDLAFPPRLPEQPIFYPVMNDEVIAEFRTK
jgi:hypothetical protein